MNSTILPYDLFCIAHRGGAGPFSENTLGAINHCLQLPIDAIEIDAWAIGDHVFVTHDRRLGRTLPGTGRLQDQTPDFLRSLKMTCGSSIASLTDVLALVKDRTQLNIELKGPGSAEPVAKCLEGFVHDSAINFDSFIISSFDHHQLLQIRRRLPSVRIGALVEGIPLDYAKCAEMLGAWSFNPSLNFISPELVTDAKRRGLKVWVYTVNDPDDFLWMTEMGVDGVFTDYPAFLIDINQRSQTARNIT